MTTLEKVTDHTFELARDSAGNAIGTGYCKHRRWIPTQEGYALPTICGLSRDSHKRKGRRNAA